MTPERVRQIAIGSADAYGSRSGDISVVARAITQAVNEALSEAKQCADSEAMFWADTDDTRAHKAARLISDNIDALKLPEEP